MSDVLLQKKASIERCIRQARTYYARESAEPFAHDHYKQDAVLLNLQRACEQCIAMANHAVRSLKLGLPATSAESFTLLHTAGMIDDELTRKLIGMVGFRNIIIHQYQDIDYQRVERALTSDSDDLIRFAEIMIERMME